jgi:predicted outer membrane lipoprotein
MWFSHVEMRKPLSFDAGSAIGRLAAAAERRPPSRDRMWFSHVEMRKPLSFDTGSAID